MRVAYNVRYIALRAAMLSTGVLCAILVVAALSPVYSQNPRCRNSANIPLPDLTTGYRGLDFGLYRGLRTTPPDDYLAIGRDRANRIRPLDVEGRPSPDGRIILMSVGMSNTSSEFGRFIADAAGNAAISRRLTILNGSMGGADAAMWTDVNSRPWQFAIAKVGGGRHSAKQVQAIWVKQAHRRTLPFPEEIQALASDLDAMLQIATRVFPNLRIVYLSSRTRSGAETRQGPGEPQAYETAFAVRRVIQERMDGAAAGTDAPWVSWGPYLWSNGTPRSDGFVWDCGDVGRDMLHPTEAGSRKVADQLMAFFMTDQTAAPWFLEQSATGTGPRIDSVRPSALRGAGPLTVDFDVRASGATMYFWSFQDGTFSVSPRPRKTFNVPGRYRVQLTAVDETGRWAQASAEISVEPPTGGGPAHSQRP